MNLLTKLKKIIPSKFYFNIFLLFIFAFVGVFLEIIGVGIIFPVIEILLGRESFVFEKISIYFEYLFPRDYINSNYFILYLLIGIFLIKNIVLYLLQWFTVSFNVNFIQTISTKLINKYLYNEYILLTNKSSSEIIRNLVNECSVLNKKVLIPILFITMDAMILLGIISLLLIVEFKITSIIIITSILLIFIYYYLSKKILYKLGLERQEYSKLVIKSAQETIQGLKLIKILKKENYFKNLFSQSFNKSLNVEKKQNMILFAPRLFTEMVFVTLFIIFIIYLLKINNDFVSIMPQLSIYFVAAIRMIPSVNRLSLNIQTIKYGRSSVELLYDEFKKFKDTVISNDKNEISPDFSNNIELKEISFSYNDNKEVLKNIDLKIKKGQMIGIIGKTGAGKSTLVNILIGLLKFESGSINLDGNILKGGLYNFKDFIGYVPQDTFLLDGSIKQNIIFTLDSEFDFNEKKLDASVKSSKLLKLIDQLPNKLNTNIGERGSKLSGGQQQRIAIARALYRDPKLLIFDEATSSLDTDTEREIIEDVNEMKGDKTLIIISHRETTLKYCDVIYKIENKKLIKIK
tara:strand:+ start:1508 stop:3232 length:1725 start_codon:yes stop_codon:yes gene_type:complete